MASLNVPIVVGESDIDRTRRLYASWGNTHPINVWPENKGAAGWLVADSVNMAQQVATPGGSYGGIVLDSAKTIPVGDVTRPSSLGMLACAWMGVPAV